MAIAPINIFGLVPKRHLTGVSTNGGLRLYYIPAAQTSAVAIGDPVVKIAASANANGVNGVQLASAGAGNAVTGVVVGFAGINPSGTVKSRYDVGSFFGYPPGNIVRPAGAQSNDYYVLVDDDPYAEFVVNSDNNYGGVAGTAVPVAAIGKNANLLAGAPNALGQSGWKLNSNSIATTANFQMSIIGQYLDPQDGGGDSNGKFIVRLNNHTEVPGASGI